MSDDLERDEGFRPTRGERPPARRSRDDDPQRSRRDEGEIPPDPRKGSGVKTVVIVLAIVGILGLCLVGSIVGGLYFAVGKVRQSAERMKNQNNLMQIGLAVHNYHDANGKLPPVAMKTKDGKPGLSWRVALLPWLENDPLYRQFKLNEAWDHPDNLRLAANMPPLFASPGRAEGNRTHYRVFAGPGSMFDPKRDPMTFAFVKDGLSNTIMVVEAEQSVLWTQPDELPFDRNGSLPPLGLADNDHFAALFGDGSVRRIKKTVSPEKIKLAINIDDGQMVNLDD